VLSTTKCKPWSCICIDVFLHVMQGVCYKLLPAGSSPSGGTNVTVQLYMHCPFVLADLVSMSLRELCRCGICV
jgi:hypothetical protein